MRKLSQATKDRLVSQGCPRKDVDASYEVTHEEARAMDCGGYILWFKVGDRFLPFLAKDTE